MAITDRQRSQIAHGIGRRDGRQDFPLEAIRALHDVARL